LLFAVLKGGRERAGEREREAEKAKLFREREGK